MARTLLYLAIFSLLSISLNAQNIKVRKVKKLPLKEKAFFPSFAQSGHQILISGKNYQGLSIYNTCRKKKTNITNAPGAGKQPVILDNQIIFREISIDKGKKNTEAKAFLTDKKTTTTIQQLPQKEIDVKPNGKNIEIYKNGSLTQTIKPLGDYFYLWCSVSPDKSRILFTAAGKGTYISDFKGSILSEIGYLNAPEWLNNNWVIGMNDKDDGSEFIASDIIAVHVKSGKRMNLTETPESIDMYPKVSPDSKRIVFHNSKGEVFLMKIKVKNIGKR